MKRQANLTEWTAGFFDGEGAVEGGVGVKESYSTGYSFHPMCRIKHSQVAGFFDAEGCIQAQIFSDNTSTVNYGVETKASLGHTTQEAGVEHALVEFCQRIGIEPSLSYSEGGENRQDYFSFRVQSKADVETFLRELYPHLIVKKPEAKIMLEEILPRLNRKEHSTKRGFLRVMKWVDRLNSHKGGKRGKYNLEYFEDKWGMTLE